MTEPATSAPSTTETVLPPPSIVRPTVIWLIVQVATVALIVARVPFWTGGGHDDDALAVSVAAQVIMSSLLVVELLPTWRAAALVAVSVVPFTHLAAVIAAAPAVRSALAAAGVLAWVATLAIWSHSAGTRFAKMVLSGVAGGVSMGGLVLLYLRADFASGAARGSEGWFGPASAVIALSRNDLRTNSADSAALLLMLFLIGSAIVAFVRSRIRKRVPLLST